LVVGRQLEGHLPALAGVDVDPVVVLARALVAQELLVEAGEGLGVRGVEDHGVEASDHGTFLYLPGGSCQR
jgi:hypothetical protein